MQADNKRKNNMFMGETLQTSKSTKKGYIEPYQISNHSKKAVYLFQQGLTYPDIAKHVIGIENSKNVDYHK